MQDDTLYNMTDNTEYQANLFAADLLINDEEIEDMVQNEDLDYFGLCSSLNRVLSSKSLISNTTHQNPAGPPTDGGRKYQVDEIKEKKLCFFYILERRMFL